MSVKNGLLELLAEEPSSCAGLHQGFEARTGRVWDLNIGQVYTTLDRLQRDGLIAALNDSMPATYVLTARGEAALAAWLETPEVTEAPPRDSLMIKLLLAVGSSRIDASKIITRQRTALVSHLQRLNRQKEALDEALELPAVLLHDALILRAEAEIRWLDLCEARLRRRDARAAR